MGCNTSKESAPTGEGDDNVKNNEEQDNKKEKDSKPESAKTITLTTNGTVILGSGSATSDKVNQKADPGEAATKIQAAFRGHKTRKSMKQTGKQEESQSTQLNEELISEDSDLGQAATKIQASFRGHLIRKQMDKKENETNPSKDKKNENEEEELDIDLTDPELNKAAVKIQASFRGHMTRKEHEHDGDEDGHDKK